MTATLAARSTFQNVLWERGSFEAQFKSLESFQEHNAIEESMPYLYRTKTLGTDNNSNTGQSSVTTFGPERQLEDIEPELRSTRSSPKTFKFSPPTFHVLTKIREEWLGCVVEVLEDSFVARLQRAASSLEEEVEIPFSSVEDIDPARIREGAIFDWVIASRIVNNTEKRIYRFYFRRVPKINKKALARSWHHGHEVFNSITARSPEVSGPPCSR